VTESGFRRLHRCQARPYNEVRLPYYAITRRDLHQQPHDHELQLPYQLYGTEFTVTDRELGPGPIEDPQRLDERRAEAGLEPFADYEARMRAPT
jgi:hypothetical protein